MKEIIKVMLEKKNWAVVGAHPNPERFGFKIFKKLSDQAYDVYAVNPMHDEVNGVKTVKTILDVEGTIDCISVVVSPKFSMTIVDQAVEKGIKYIWFQPGSFNNDIIKYAKEQGLNVVYNACVLLEL